MEKIIYCNLDLCVGCGACAVACMDENDINLSAGEKSHRRVYAFEEFADPEAPIVYTSASCMHCEESLCSLGCPTGAIARDPRTGAVTVKRELCIGCHSCALACPFGVPRYDHEEKMVKCDLCSDRTSAGLEPACVRVCPFDALTFATPDEMSGNREVRWLKKMIGAR